MRKSGSKSNGHALLAFALALSGAAGVANAEDWKGFRKVEMDSTFPHADLARKSVFRVQTFNGWTEAKFKVVDVAKEKKVTSKKVLDTDYYSIQVETCRRYGLKKCPVSTLIATATVFLDGGTVLRGCRHTFQNWLAVASKLNGMPPKEVHPPFWLYDYTGKIIYNSAYSPATASVDFFNTADNLNLIIGLRYKAEEPRFASYYAAADYMTLRLSDAIATPTLFNNAVPFIPEKVYIFGYPARTKYFGGVKNGDAPGDTLVSTSGTMTKYFTLHKIVYADSIGGPGLSGGPMINAEGNLIGVNCRGGKSGSEGTVSQEELLTYIWEKILPLWRFD